MPVSVISGRTVFARIKAAEPSSARRVLVSRPRPRVESWKRNRFPAAQLRGLEAAFRSALTGEWQCRRYSAPVAFRIAATVSLVRWSTIFLPISIPRGGAMSMPLIDIFPTAMRCSVRAMAGSVTIT